MSEAVDPGGRTFWVCRFCGNARFLLERPTKCFHCRRGESALQLNDERLFERVRLPER